MLDFARLRRIMVDNQVRTFDVTDRDVLAVLDEIPRERFVPAAAQDLAYSDQHLRLPSASGHRFLLAPMVLARLIQGLEIEPGAKALDVGAGTGYSSLILSRLGAQVIALESDERLAAESRRVLSELDGSTIRVVEGPLANGLPTEGQYDAILINGSFERRPDALLAQLADGGRLAGIDCSSGAGKGVIFQRSGSAFGHRVIFDAAAPLLAEFKAAPAFVF